MKSCLIIAFAFVAILIAALGIWSWWTDFWPIDGCLDAGGRWNYELRQCEFEPQN